MNVSKDYALPTTGSTGDSVAAILFALKALLTGQVEGTGEIPEEARWVHVKSCDSLTVSAVTDLFGATWDATKWVWAIGGNAHSWGVWRNPDSTKWLLIDLDSVAGSSYLNVVVKFATADFSTGGTTTDAPTSAGAPRLFTGTHTNAIFGSALAPGVAHVAMDDDSEFVFGVTYTSTFDAFGPSSIQWSSSGANFIFDAGLVAPGYVYTQDSGLGTEAVAICNRALIRAGSSEVITALTDDSEAARLCNAVFALCRDEVLSEADWPFARRRAVLTQIEDLDHQAWGYGYSLPADYIETREIWNGARRPLAQTAYSVELRDDGAGHMLLTDASPTVGVAPYLKYTARVESVSLFSLKFSDALAWRIASDIAFALTGKAELQDRAMKLYEYELSKAEVSAAEGESADPAPDSEFVTSRS